MTHNDAARRCEHIAKMQVDAAFLVRLTFRQGNVSDVFVDPHQRKSQVGLARVTLRGAANETSPDPIAQQRPCARIGDRRPYHEAWNRVITVANPKNEV